MFSVVIPAYNCSSTIVKVLDSVYLQTRLDLIEEIIIVNDGSTDNTKNIIGEYKRLHPIPEIRYFEQKNKGVSSARNKGIREAVSDWIALLDSDDLWMPDKIEKQAVCVMCNPDICFLGSSKTVKLIFKEYRRGLIRLNAHQLCIRSTPTTPSVIFKRGVALELGLFDEDMHYCEDINFYQKFLLKDSYYILVDDLVKIGIEKKYHGESGLSSKLIDMNRGRNKNVIDLFQMRLIGRIFLTIMILFNYIKLIRRIVVKKYEKMIWLEDIEI